MNETAAQHPLLLEIGIEEMPSDVIAPTLKQLSALTLKSFAAANLSSSAPQVYGTPRRLILFVPTIQAMQETTSEWVVGPPKRAAYDASGNPTRAASGFAASQGVSLSETQILSAETLGSVAKGKKGEYLVIQKQKQGVATASLLCEMLPEILSKLRFPRAMRWNETDVSFVRPIHSILALYNAKIVPFSFAGIQSSDRAYGHHMMSPAAFQVTDFASYREALKGRKVIIDPDERVKDIESQMKALAKEKGGHLDLSDQSLLLDAAYTVEYPKALCGDFDLDFLEIPKEIITTAMAEHQGYSPLYDDAGALLPHFLTILNIDAQDLSVIQKGNERVLRARLVDARFYFDLDRKTKLADFVPALKRVTFQEKLGSLFEKVERIVHLAAFIAKEINCSEAEIQSVERAARLCKADLVTGVVREFTSLQGTMGRIYAALDGEAPAVAEAIEAHYLPKYSGGALPSTLPGQILSIADKLDSIVGCFGAGLIPSGSEDPYALRRQGLGLIQIILVAEEIKTLSLDAVFSASIQQYLSQNKFSENNLLQALSAFLKQRLDAHLQTEGLPYDLRDAVLAQSIDRPADLLDKATALLQFSKVPLFSPLMTAFKRAVRILPEGFKGHVNPDILSHPAEKKLHEALLTVEQAVQELWADRKYKEILETLAILFEPLNQFFEGVMVMDKDKAIRENRLSLLHGITQQFEAFADFSKIVEA